MRMKNKCNGGYSFGFSGNVGWGSQVRNVRTSSNARQQWILYTVDVKESFVTVHPEI